LNAVVQKRICEGTTPRRNGHLHRSGRGLSESSSRWRNTSQIWVKLLTDFVVFNIPIRTVRPLV